MRAPPTKPDPPVTNALRQRFGRSSPHILGVLHGLFETLVTFAFPLLSRVIRTLVHAVLLVVSVSRKVPSGFAIDTR